MANDLLQLEDAKFEQQRRQEWHDWRIGWWYFFSFVATGAAIFTTVVVVIIEVSK